MSRQASETAQRTQPVAPTVPHFVKMRSFGIGKQSTARTTLFTGLLLMLSWWYATEAGVTSSLFLPSPGQVLTLAQEIVFDGYANATLWEHLAASLKPSALAL